MIAWVVPTDRYAAKPPLMLAALAAQKNHNALYLICAYADADTDAALRTAYAAAGRKIDMGKSCLRFKTRDGLVDEAIASVIRDTSPEKLIAGYEASRSK